MKRAVLVLWLLPALAMAQPVNPGGLAKVIHTTAFTGDGTRLSSLDLTHSCSSGQVLQWNGSLWVCAAAGGLSGLTTNAILRATSSTTAGNGNATDDLTTFTIGEACTVSGTATINNHLIVASDPTKHIDAITATNTPSATTVNFFGAEITAQGTADATASAVQSFGAILSSTTTRSAGANQVQNIALRANASGGQASTGIEANATGTGANIGFSATATGGSSNTALQTVGGNVSLNTTSGTTLVTGHGSTAGNFQITEATTGTASGATDAYVNDTGTHLGDTSANNLKASYGVVIAKNGSCSDCTVANTKGHNSFALDVTANGDETGDNAVYNVAAMFRHGDIYTNYETGWIFAGGPVDVNGNAGVGVVTETIQPHMAGGSFLVGGCTGACAGFANPRTDGATRDGNLHILANNGTSGIIYLNNTGNGKTEIDGSGLAIVAPVTNTPTLQNGAKGYDYYTSAYSEWNEEWLYRIATTGAQFGVWALAAAGTGATASTQDGIAYTGRPGVQRQSLGTTATGRAAHFVGMSTLANQAGDVFVEEEVFLTSALSSATDGYSLWTGLWDTPSAVDQGDGCYFLYDERQTAPAPATGARPAAGSHTVSCICEANAVKTQYAMDGTTVSDESFTTVATTLTASAWWRFKVILTGTTRAEFYVDTGSGFAKTCDINTHIPSGTARAFGGGLAQLKNVGTTSVNVDFDFSSLAWTLGTPRT